MRRANSFRVLGKFAKFHTTLGKLTTCSAKELDHFERIRRTFESVDKQKQGQAPSGSQTIEDALEALSMGNQVDGVGVVDGPVVNENGDHPPAAGKGKGKHGRGMSWIASSLPAGSKGKGKTNSSGPGGKLKNKAAPPAADESDSSFESHKPGMRNGRGASRKYDDVGEEDEVGAEVDGDDEYVIRTDHLKAESK